jgi:hypothetical protein
MNMTSRLVQFVAPSGERLVGLVDEPELRIIDGYASVYELALGALEEGEPLPMFAWAHAGSRSAPYDDVWDGAGGWRVLPAIDHPTEPARCLISGTGLTHRRSVDTRQAMHAADATVTDSMRMYELGEAGGRPEHGAIGTSPEWFYKGSGTVLRGHGEPLLVPAYAEDGGEEPEVAGVYLIDPDGAPRRIGMAAGNEFADHRLERRNYLYLAHSKLRMCAIGPELVLDPDFSSVTGEVAIEREGRTIWSRPIRTGDAAMCHTLENIEHHHFKYEAHRRPGDLHVHFVGADAFSFGDGLDLQSGDVMQIAFAGFGRPLRNPLAAERAPEMAIRVVPL